MKTETPSGTVIAYCATCALAVVVTTPGAMIFTIVLADFVGSLTLVAVTVAVVFCATAGDVKRPRASTVPPPEPLTDQVTPEVSLVTVAVSCTVCALPANAGAGETETEIGCWEEEEQPEKMRRDTARPHSAGVFCMRMTQLFPNDGVVDRGSWTTSPEFYHNKARLRGRKVRYLVKVFN